MILGFIRKWCNNTFKIEFEKKTACIKMNVDKKYIRIAGMSFCDKKVHLFWGIEQ